jgi:hyperosmotically inducible periplasmic protein
MRFAYCCLSLSLALGPLCGGCTAQQQQQTQTQAKQASLVPRVFAKLVAIDVDAANNVKVSEDNGVVTLAGRARTTVERDSYVAAAKATDGVVSVRDELTIDQQLHGARETSADAALVVRIQAAIAGQSGINALHVAPSVHDGAVVLKGTVSSPALDRVIVQTVRSVDGVKSVSDQIVVKR